MKFCAIGRLKRHAASCIEYQHVTAAVRDEAEAWDRHILDSAALLPVLQEAAAAAGLRSPKLRILDVGSGAGLPGIVLAMLMPAWQVGALLRRLALWTCPSGKAIFLLLLICSKWSGSGCWRRPSS